MAERQPRSERQLRQVAVALGRPALIIVVLGALLLLVPQDRVRYELPTMPAFSVSAVDEVWLRQPKLEVVLRRSAAGAWTVAGQESAAKDAGAKVVGDLVAAVAGVRFSDLVSRGDGGGGSRYGMNDTRRIDIELRAGGTTVSELSVGNVADRSSTFVQVPGDRRIYQVAGDMRSAFSLPPADYRDLQVLAFDAEAVEHIDVAGWWPSDRDGRAADATRVSGALSRGEERGGAWTVVAGAAAGTVAAADVVAAAVGRASELSAIRYTDQASGEPLVRVTFHVEAERHELAIYADPGNRYAATSSQRQDPFFLFNWIAEQLLQLVEVVARSAAAS